MKLDCFPNEIKDMIKYVIKNNYLTDYEKNYYEIFPSEAMPFDKANATITHATNKQIDMWIFKPPKLSMPLDISSTLSLSNKTEIKSRYDAKLAN